MRDRRPEAKGKSGGHNGITWNDLHPLVWCAGSGPSQKNERPCVETTKRNMEAAAYRLGKNVNKVGNQWAVNRYKSQLEEVQRRLIKVRETGRPTT